MAQVVHEKGKLKEYTAQISFGLNFEDNRQSVKVAVGDSVFFDGENALYTKNGTEFAGKTPSLKSAISSEWLIQSDGEAAVEEVSQPARPQSSASTQQFDPKKGGNFQEFLNKEQKGQVIHENDQVVKNLEAKTTVEDQDTGKHEVAGDQVAVKENLVVGSSTSVARKTVHSTDVSHSEHYGAERTIPLKSSKTASEVEEKKEKKTYTVDGSTPRLPEDATRSEIDRATGVNKVEAETQEAAVIKKIGEPQMEIQKAESQDAEVVRKIGERPETQTTEGVTLKKTESKKDMTIDTQVNAPGEMKINTQVGSAEANQKKEEAAKAAEKRAAERKAASSKSSEGESSEDKSSPDTKKKTAKKSSKKSSKKSTPKPPKTVKREDGSPDYLAMMPDDWSKLHWVKKEKFIMALEDADFVEFILKVETVNAVQNACKKRLEELGQTVN